MDAGDGDAIVILDIDGAELSDRSVITALVTEIYGHAREGRIVVVARRAPALATACAEVGLAVSVAERATEETARGADVVFADHVRLKGANVVTPPPLRGRKLRVAVAGLGRIGEGAALRLAGENSDYLLCGALVREPFKERPALAVDQLTNDLTAFFATRPDVVIDALPDGHAGRALIVAALDRGVSVVTANKQAIAGRIVELAARAERAGAAFCFSAAVGGGAPFVETAARARRSGAVRSLEAVVNGTVNFILTSLEKGEAFEEAVKAAQAAGFAEPDPSADLTGADARAKISILSFAAFGEEIAPDAIRVEALDAESAARMTSEGGCWKQIARLERAADGAFRASVGFERRDRDPLFADARFEANALRIALGDGRMFECRGKGAGRNPTVESILGDLGSIRRKRPPASRAVDAPVAAIAVSA
ncbi:MAG: hypothetical protein HXY21_10250 [Parvularculaceae bacterium]|nr:hypothetical protein [Parvularculaceae bacterium]